MKNKIKIKKSKVGTFTKAAKAHGKTVSEFENQVLSHPENYSKAMRKKAQFSKNAKKWKHEDGGEIDMFPNGGTTNPPIYVTDPNDPRLQAHQDSLNIIYRPWFNNLGGDYVGATESIKSFTTPISTEINLIPFKAGTYFTREQQGQETGGKEYFDKKTGKKLGKFPFGGLSVAPLIGRKNQDLFNFNSLGISQTMQNSRGINPQFGLEKVINTPPIGDPLQMAQWLAYSSSPQAKQDWMNKATPLQKSLSGLANPEGAEMLSSAFMKNGGKIKKKLKKYGDAGTVDIQPNDYWNYEGFSPQALPQTEQPYNLQIADYQSGYENAPIPENGFSSINLTEDQKRNMLSDKQKRKGFKPNIDQNIMTSDPYLNRVMQGLNSNNPVGFAKAGIAGSAGISNLGGNIKKNKFTRGQENNLLFNQIDGALYNPYNYDYNDYRFGQNRNQAFFEDGGVIHAPEMKGFFRKKKR